MLSRLCFPHCLFSSPLFPELSSLPHFVSSVPSPHVELSPFHYDSKVSVSTIFLCHAPLLSFVSGYLLNINYNYIPN